MKKLSALVLSLLMIFVLAACGDNGSSNAPSSESTPPVSQSTADPASTSDAPSSSQPSANDFPSIDGFDDSEIPDILKMIVGTLDRAEYMEYPSDVATEPSAKGIILSFANVTEDDYRALLAHYESGADSVNLGETIKQSSSFQYNWGRISASYNDERQRASIEAIFKVNT